MVEPIVPPSLRPSANTSVTAAVPDAFPFFKEQVKQVAKDSKAAETRLGEAQSALDQHKAISPALKVASLVPVFRPLAAIDVGRGEMLRLERNNALVEVARTQFFSRLFNDAPNLMQAGVVESFDDYIALTEDNQGMLTDQDLQLAREEFEKIEIALDPFFAAEDDADVPDFLKPTPEQAAEIRQAFALDRQSPDTIHRITVNALIKSLTQIEKLTIPEDWTDTQFLQYAAIMDIPADTRQAGFDRQQLVAPYVEAIKETNDKIRAVLSGEEEWETPQMSLWQQAQFVIASPMQIVADIVRPYLEHVNYPLAAISQLAASRMLNTLGWTNQPWGIEDSYARMREQGFEGWEALGKAWEEADLPWYSKLGVELLTDPLTYTPGVLLKVPGLGLKVAGRRLLSGAVTGAVRSPRVLAGTSLEMMGERILYFNRGLWQVLDIPFDGFKTLWAKIPKSFNQATNAQLTVYRGTLRAAVEKTTGRSFERSTAGEIAETLTIAQKAFRETPQLHGNAYVALGEMMIKHPPLTRDQISVWSRKLGGDLGKEVEGGTFGIAEKVVTDVEDVISDAIIGIGSLPSNAKRIAMALGVDDTPAIIGKIIKDIGAITSRYTARTARAIQIGKTAQVNPQLLMVDFLVTTQKQIIDAIERSPYARGRAFNGMITGLMNKTDALEKGIWRTTIDRWLVRPMAEAYLASVAYPIWNMFEGIGVSILEGVVPRQSKIEAFRNMFLGLTGVDQQILSHTSSDTVNLLRTMPGRDESVSFFKAVTQVGRAKAEAQPISVLPGVALTELSRKLKAPKWIAGADWFKWIDQNWIAMSAVMGDGLRRNFLMQKMANSLAQFSYDVSGHDINAAFSRIINRGFPKNAISKKGLGLNDHTLQQEMFERLGTGIKQNVLDAKELYSNEGLMRAEAIKILRQSSEISPQAKTLGEQMIDEGVALRSEQDVVDFARVVAEQSIADLRSFPLQAPESFSFMADMIEKEIIQSPEDLIKIFKTYEVMSDTSGQVSTKLLSQTMETANLLKAQKKFKELEELWRTSREEVEKASESIGTDLARVNAVIRAKASLLPQNQQLALNSLLERSGQRQTLQGQFLKSDGALLDDFWALPKAQRTEAEHTALRAFRAENISKFKDTDAILYADNFLERKTYAQLYYELPKPRLVGVNAAQRSLTPDDVSKVMGTNVDALTTGIMENMTFQEKPYFVQMIMKNANANSNIFKGFSEDKVGQVYDNIIAGMRLSPGQDVAKEKILQQAGGMQQRMLGLRMNKSMTPTEELNLHNWIDDVAEGADEVFGKEIPAIPEGHGFGERVSTTADVQALDVEFKNLAAEIGDTAAKAQIGKVIRGDVIIDTAVEDRIRFRAVELANQSARHVTTTEGQINKQINNWFRFPFDERRGGNAALQRIGKIATEDKIYREGIQEILREQYPSGFIRIFRGSGRAEGRGLDREFVNVTSSKRTAVSFENTWLVKGKDIEVDDILIKVEDVLAIGAVEESEMVIRSSALRKYFGSPLEPTAGKQGGIITKEAWEQTRQQASEAAHKEYYKAFADYSHENIIDALGKSIYPFWTYHMYRWYFLPRTFIRHPGTATAWGKYSSYTDNGYIHIPGTDLEFSPAVGSAFGATFTLARHDFPSYYENLGWAGEVLDATQRRGWFPNALWSGAVALTPILSGRPPELGEVLAPVQTVGLNLLVVSDIPGVASAAQWLKDRVFHSNFHDYYTATIVDNNQIAAGGKLIGGQSGQDLWFKRLRGTDLTPDEQKAWDDAFEEAAWHGILRSEFPEFRMRPEEMLEARAQVTSLIEAQTGMTADFQDNLWKHNMRPTDVTDGFPQELRNALDQMWEWRIFFGRGAILMAPEYSDLHNKMNLYYDKVETFQIDRIADQAAINQGFLTPTAELHFGRGEWIREYAKNWSTYVTKVENLEADPEFADAREAMTPEGAIRLARELGFTVPSPDPFEEVKRLYFEIELTKTKDRFTGEEDWDYLKFWVEREAVRFALPEDQRADFDSYIRRFQTPMEALFKQVTKDYLRGYRAVSRIVLQEFTEEEQALIAEFNADTTTRKRSLEIKEVLTEDNKKLIAKWNSRRTQVRSALRVASPQLDFWLYVFGNIDKPKTSEAEVMVKAWEEDRTFIVRGISETSLLQEKLEKGAARAEAELQE